MPSLGIAPWPRKLRRCSSTISAGLAPVSGVFPTDANFHLLEIGIQAIQLFAISRGSPSAPSRAPGPQGDFKVVWLIGLLALWLVVRVGRPEVGVFDHGLVAGESLVDVVTRSR